MNEGSLNAVFSTPAMRRRYEVWFLRLGLADGSGAWWFRYLLMNLGRSEGGCPGNPHGMPLQVWATWFPRGGKPLSFIQGFSKEQLSSSQPGAGPFRLEIAGNRMCEDSCAGQLAVDGHTIAWNLRYRSTAAFALSDKGWIGFSRTPHSDAVFAGEIALDGQLWRGDPLGYGVEGHNCGYRHRHSWTWAHCIVPDSPGGISTFEALEHEMPLGLRFRKAVLWHAGREYRFPKLRSIERSRETLRWTLHCSRHEDGVTLVAVLDGSGASAHRLPYLKTNCSGSFEVANNSLAAAKLYFRRPDARVVEFRTDGGAVLEMVGD
jgi:hypothetical protein